MGASSLFATELAAAPRWQDREHVFGSGALRGFQGWSKAKAELDERIVDARKKAGSTEPMPHWTLHDIRRSFVTHVGERSFAEPHVIVVIVNHVSGAKGGDALSNPQAHTTQVARGSRGLHPRCRAVDEKWAQGRRLLTRGWTPPTTS